MPEKKYLEGIFDIDRRDGKGIWLQPFDRSSGYYNVTSSISSKLKPGARITFTVQRNKQINIEKINGIHYKDYSSNRHKIMTVINPDMRINFSSSKFESLRILDMMVPIGLGCRGLIISPPRAGKTVLLEQLAIELGNNSQIDKLFVLLIDERPEEVTSFKRNTNAIVYHSDMDNVGSNHVRLAELMLKNIEQEVACGNNIVVLLDSLTRLTRASNLDERSSGRRIMSGGLGTNALQIPRKLLGQARNIENGGSCTILATVLKDTGSRMDEIIFQEFKGTGNCEIFLDSKLSDQRVYPAINLLKSGTRKDELLHSVNEYDKIQYMRRKLLGLSPELGISKVLNLINKYSSNDQLLDDLK